MAERTARIYSLPENLHAPGAPVLISAGMLLRDIHSSQLLAQLKLQNITDGTIISVTLRLIGLDESGHELCRTEQTLSDLNAGRDAFFGTKEGIALPEAAVRSMRVQLCEVLFADGDFWAGGDETWSPLPAQDSLNIRLFDTEIVRQYKLETSDQSRFVPVDAGDVWLCACGAVNGRDEPCHCCGQTLEHCLEYLNIDVLRENKALRLNAEAMKASIEEARRRSRSTFVRRLLYVLIPLLLLGAAAAGVYYFTQRRNTHYEEAVALYEIGDYTGAVRLFDKLGSYRDAAEYSARAKKADALLASYSRACKLLENGRWDDACAAFEELGDYEDSARLALESRYSKGQAMLAEGSFEQARAVFQALGSYRDSPQIVAHFYDRLVSEELSLNEECGGPLTTSYRYDPQGRVLEKTEHFSAYDGMSDRVYTYSYRDDGSYSILESQVQKHYDAHDNYLGQGGHLAFTYDYAYYDDGSVHYCAKRDAESGELLGGIVYDEHGNPEQYVFADGSANTIRNEYKDEHLVKQESYDAGGSMLTRMSYEYDELGRLKRTSFLTPGALAAVTNNYSYGIVYVPEPSE